MRVSLLSLRFPCRSLLVLLAAGAIAPLSASESGFAPIRPHDTETPAGAASADGFEDIVAGLPGIDGAAVAWGDHDNDGDLDLLLAGGSSSGVITRLFDQGPPGFYDTGTSLASVSGASLQWGDYNRDGDLDIALTGSSGSTPTTRIYRGGPGGFTDIGADLLGVRYGSVAWGDYDNDGDLDLLIAGEGSGYANVARIYRNNMGTFSDIGAAIAGVSRSSATWGDYDGDGDLDVLLAGYGDSGLIASIYRNDAGSFTDIGAGLPGLYYCSLAWGDYDNDGDLDILLAGDTGPARISRVYRNDAGVFTDIAAGLPGIFSCSVAWGDCDDDGDLDILLAGGTDGSTRIARVYRNNSGTFSDIAAGLPGVSSPAVAWADYDNDGDLDFVLAGHTGTERLCRVYRNTTSTPNDPPDAPAGLSVRATATTLTLEWLASTDDHTPPEALSYNLRVGVGQDRDDIVPAMGRISDGRRYVVRPGNAGQRLSWTIPRPLLTGAWTYYWSVQALDQSFQGSDFSQEQMLSYPFLERIDAPLQAATDGCTAWGDYDGDGDLDLLMAGQDDLAIRSTVIYRNDEGSFVNISAGLPGVAESGAAWGDYDNDGDLDLLLTGASEAGAITRVYRNNGGSFADAGAGLEGVHRSAVAWGDYDNDGDLDIALTGRNDAGQAVSRIYRRQGGSYTDIGASLEPVSYSAVAWGDRDRDGDLDLLLAGWTGGARVTHLYENNAGVFIVVPIVNLPAVSEGSLAWGDYDSDGDLDVLLTGSTATGSVTSVYRNTGGFLLDAAAGLPGVHDGSAVWGDYDDDGDLDILLTGTSETGAISRIYRYNGSGFVEAGAGLPGLSGSSAAWGDADNDGDLDIAIAGTAGGGAAASVYRNPALTANAPPSSPGNLTISGDASTLAFQWAAAADDHTPTAGLSYNLRVGTNHNGSEIVPAMADPGSGRRRLAQSGNAGQSYSWSLARPVLPPGQSIYWSVQALDHSFAGSTFAPEQVVTPLALTDIGAAVEGVDFGAAVWGDYDNDGDLDFVLTGQRTGGKLTRLYRNDAGAFTNVAGVPFPGLSHSTAAWGDYDRDGDLDLLLAGTTTTDIVSGLYRNDTGTFVDVAVGLPGVARPSLAWGDFDNDGDLDLFIGGGSSEHPPALCRIYRNDSGALSDLEADLPDVINPSAAWGDYDNDGDLDLVVMGLAAPSQRATRLYRNDAGAFQQVSSGLPGLSDGSLAWGDYDNDGDLDLLTAGASDAGPISNVYRNDAGDFHDIGAGMVGIYNCSVAWGDCDNDGDLDVLLSGYTGYEHTSKIYRNVGGSYVDTAAPLVSVSSSSVAWGDYDSDGDLDVLLTGSSPAGRSSRIYRNDASTVNAAPSTPGGLWTSSTQAEMTFHWSAATDDHTGSSGLSYNLCVGTAAGLSDLVPAMADLGTGRRLLPSLGNAGEHLWHTMPLSALGPGPTIYWSVQAIDPCFRASAFAAPQEVVPVALASLSAEATAAGVAIEWSIPLGNNFAGFLLDRQATGTETIERITSEPIAPDPSTRRYRYLDDGVAPGEDYTYSLIALQPDGAESLLGRIRIRAGGILELSLGPIAPNPVRTSAMIPYTLPAKGVARLEIMDLSGRRVARLLDGLQKPGAHLFGWDGSGGDGRLLPSGAYFARLVWKERERAQRFTLVR